MSYAPPRSALDELHTGMVEPTWKTAHTNRGGVVDPATAAARAGLDRTVWHTGLGLQGPARELPDASGAV